MLTAVIDINIDATTGADLNHFVRKILKSDFIGITQSMLKQLGMQQLQRGELECSKET